MNRTVHAAVYDTLADWEIGYLLVELRTGRFTGAAWQVVTVAEMADPVAAICGATAGMARAGLLDERRHTSATAGYLLATGYGGADHYVEDRAVVDGHLITAGPQSPVHFASATLQHLGLASPQVLEAYERVFHAGDPTGYAVLMEATG